MTAIFQKEMTQYFTSLMGYIFIGIFTAISGIVFYLVNLASLNSDIKTFFSSIITFLIFLIPVVTMRIYAEEKKQKTEEMLLTAPVEMRDIILGKFFAALCLFLIPMAITFAYPVILSIYGTLEIYVVLGNYLGIVLVASSFIAIGIFISVLSENQIIAAILTYCVLITIFSVNKITMFVQHPLVEKLVSFISVDSHYTTLSYGVLDFVDVAYFISLTVLFLFFSTYVLDRKRVIS